MFDLAIRKPDTRELVRAEHRLRAAPPRRPWLWAIFALLCLIGALLWLRHEENAAHQRQLEALAVEKQTLRVALEQGRLQRQEARATEQQLLRRIAQLSAQIERLQTDLAFFRQQKKGR